MFNMSRIVEITETYGENGNTDNYTFDIFVANFGSGVNYTFNYCAIITKL